MPVRPAIFVISLITLFASGCTTWPTPEHRAVTNNSIRAIVTDVAQSQDQSQQPPPVLECSGLESVNKQLQRQRTTLHRLSEEIQALTAANPSFANSDCPAAGSASDNLDGRTLVGSSEWIYISPPGHHYKARIDSGAATSSLSARNIERFERNGEKWVKFDLQHDDETDPIPVEAPLVRHIRIRQASADEIDRRPVVKLTVNLGNSLQQDTEFSLTDRSQMTYPILLGRSFLRDVTLIDVGQRFIQPKFVPDQVKPQSSKEKTPGKEKAPEKKAKSVATPSTEEKTNLKKQQAPAADKAPAVKQDAAESKKPESGGDSEKTDAAQPQE